MRLLRVKEQHEADHERIEEELAERERHLVDMATRLARLEAEVGIYRPLFIDDEKGSP